MTTSRLIATSITLFTLAACTTDTQVRVGERCVTCFNNPITGEPIGEHDAGTTAERQVRIQTHRPDPRYAISDTYEIDTVVTENVDVLFVRFKRAWNMKSPEDIRAERGGLQADLLLNQDNRYQWDVMPGVSYRIKTHLGGPSDYLFYDLSLEKAGVDKTFVNIRYHTQGSVANPTALMSHYLNEVDIAGLSI